VAGCLDRKGLRYRFCISYATCEGRLPLTWAGVLGRTTRFQVESTAMSAVEFFAPRPR
jgi:hypothetical protein